MKITSYTKTKHAQQIKTLFREIYPEWDEMMLEKMAYNESHSGHIKTKIAVEEDVLVGQANAFWIDREKRIANLGYHIHPGYQKRGLGYQLTRSLIADLRHEVAYFVVLTTQDNLASQKLCEKLGFTEPSSEISAVVTKIDKNQKIPEPYFKALSVDKNSKT